MFKEMDTVIGDNNWQSGDDRMPILVLMSDGACSTGTSNYTNVGTSNVGNGNESNLTAGNTFLTQLTAAYVMAQIEAHYQKNNPDVRGLFYTLGFNIGNALEIKEAIDVLKGKDVSDLKEVCLTLAANIIRLSENISIDEARKKVEYALESGAAYEKFKEFIGVYTTHFLIVEFIKQLVQSSPQFIEFYGL